MRPLGWFLIILRPAILALNGLGNGLLRLIGLQPGTGEQSLHSPEELRILVSASQDAGLLHEVQEEVVLRVLTIGKRPISHIMTPRLEIEWIDADDGRESMLRTVRGSRHEQFLVGRGSITDPLGMVLKVDLLDQALDGQPVDPVSVIREPLLVHESASVFAVLEQFKRAPVRMAMIVDEYGTLEGIVTQTGLLAALAGDLADSEGEDPDIVARADGSLLIDGLTLAHATFERLGLCPVPKRGFHTIAGFALDQLGHLPKVGERFSYDGWTFEVVDLDGRRIDKLLAIPSSRQAGTS